MSEAQEQIRAQLAKLDVKNDDHWTENGLPRLDALGLKDLKRADVTSAAPLFNRTKPELEAAPAPVAPPEPAKLGPTEQEEYNVVAAECAAAEKKLQEAQDMAKLALSEAQALAVRRDAALKRLEKLRPKDENMQGIRAVLQRGQEMRAERAEIAKQLKAAGVTATLLQSGSPLDRAMARKRGYGLERPKAVGAR